MSSGQDEDPLITTRRAAMNMLARREHTYSELHQKLTQKYPDFDENEVIDSALDRLRSENLQSDERFVESFVRFKANNGTGPLKIEAELRGKGAKDNLIKQYVYAEDQDWNLVCKQVYEKKYSAFNEMDQRVREKVWRFLSQRGFNSETIRKVVK